MSAKGYAEFLKSMGHNVREAAGVYWFNVYPRVYSSFPFERKVDPGTLVVADVLCGDGWILRYPCDMKHGRASYRLVCSDISYGFNTLNGKARNQTRRGLEKCSVRQVSFEELMELGPKLNQETLARQGREIPRDFHENWQRYYSAASNAEGAHAWGAFADHNLAAYLIAFEISDVAHILIVRSSSEFLGLYPNNALLYSYVQNTLISRKLREVSIGMESIRSDMNSLDHFKLGMGFVAEPIGQRIEFAPWLRAVMHEPLVSGFIKVAELMGNNEKLDKFAGLLRWYKEQRKSS